MHSYYTAGYAMGAFSSAFAGSSAIAFTGSAGSFSALASSSLGTAMVGGFVGGAVSSASLTAIGGGNLSQVGQAALMGGLAGAAGAAVGYGIGSMGSSSLYSDFGKVAGNTVNAGIRTEGNGKAMGRAAMMAGAMVVADRIFTASVNSARNSGTATAKDHLTTQTPADPVYKAKGIDIAGNSGEAIPAQFGTGVVSKRFVDGATEFNPVAMAIAKSPLVVNPTAVLHDSWGGFIEQASMWNPITNYGTMLPAAAVTYAAFGSYTPLAGSLAASRDY